MLQLTNCTANNLCGSDSIFNNSPRFFRSNLGAKIGVKNMFQRWHFRPDKPITRQNQQIQYITVNVVWNYAVKLWKCGQPFCQHILNSLMLFSFSHTHFGQLFYLEKQLALYIHLNHKKSWSAVLIRKAVGPIHFNQKELVRYFNQKSSWPYTF